MNKTRKNFSRALHYFLQIDRHLFYFFATMTLVGYICSYLIIINLSPSAIPAEGFATRGGLDPKKKEKKKRLRW